MFMPGVWFLWSKKKNCIFQKENGNTLTLLIIIIVKSLQKEQIAQITQYDPWSAGISQKAVLRNMNWLLCAVTPKNMALLQTRWMQGVPHLCLVTESPHFLAYVHVSGGFHISCVLKRFCVMQYLCNAGTLYM